MTPRPRCPGCDHCQDIPKRSGISWRHPDGPYRIRSQKGGKQFPEQTRKTLAEAIQVWHDNATTTVAVVQAKARGKRTTVADYALDRYIPNQRIARSWSARTERKYRHSVECYLADSRLGRMRVGDVEYGDVVEYFAWLSVQSGVHTRRRYSRSTVEGVWTVLSGMFRYAVRDGRRDQLVQMPPMPKVAADGVRLAAPAEVAPPTKGELAQLFAYLDVADPQLARMARLAQGTGLRIGEIQALVRPNVDRRNRLIRIEATWDGVEGVRDETKSKRSNRQIRVADWILDLFDAERDDQDARGGTTDVRRFVFTRRDGLPREQWHIRQELTAALDASGVAQLRQNRGVEPMTFHDLRHFFVTDRFDAGKDPREVAAYVGDTLAAIERTYVHFIQSMNDRVADGVVSL